jgi:GT2 family glycosyltransferase
MIRESYEQLSTVTYDNLGSNLGGGGGFYYGARRAFKEGFDWIWLMDDDCLATSDCLRSLITRIIYEGHIYSPIVVSSEDRRTVLWGIKAGINSGAREVTTLPFNGFLIHRSSLASLGFPEKKFFIYGDDTEYNMRAKASGRKIIMITESIMYHPHKNKLSGLKITEMFLNKLWAYYKLRNAIIIYRKYRYVSVNQMIMCAGAFMLYLSTLKINYLKIWLKALTDGIHGRLYVNRSLL